MNNEMVITEDLTTALMGEVLLLGLLGKAIYEEPDREWLNELIGEGIFTDTPFGVEHKDVIRGLEILQQWSRSHVSGISDEDFADLKMDYTRLFIGLDTMPAAPWESVYFNRERLVFQEQTLQVRNWYARFGLQVERINKEPDDHIGLEILFMAHLASLALQSIEQQNQIELDALLQAQRDFLSEHVLRWGPTWAKLVEQHAATDFYRGIACLAHGAFFAAADLLDVQFSKEASQ